MLKITRTDESKTEITLTITVNAEILAVSKKHAIEKLGKDVKVTGFRAGNAPANLVEKAIEPSVLAEEFLNEAINHSYPEAIRLEKINPIAQPRVEVLKFVPYDMVEYKATISVLGDIKLADYKKLGVQKAITAVTKKDVQKVIDNMQVQLATRKDVDRAAKVEDQVWINFDGKDAKGVAVNGAKGDNYPLVLGSNTFIPGFEDHVLGMKTGEEKEFTITFPKDYGVKALQSKKVSFKVDVIKVQEIEKPAVDKEFVEKVAPGLTSVEDLHEDIKKQLQVEASSKDVHAYENAIVAELIEKSSVDLPDELINEQAENVLRELQQNIMYRGQTMQEYLDGIGMTADEQREKEVLPEAIRRLRAGILLSEVAEKEAVAVTPEELQDRIATLKERYASDAEMQKQLKDPNAQREIGAQLLTEKTLAKIVDYNS
jgi:trigger factor